MQALIKWIFLMIPFLILMSHPSFAAGVYTTFDSDREGWTYYVSSGSGDSYPEANHDSGGYLTALTTTERWYFFSPGNPMNPAPPYGGDWTQLYGGTISFDLYVGGDGSSQIVDSDYDLFIDVPGLIDPNENGTYFFTSIDLGPLNQWNTYSFLISDLEFEPGPNIATPLSANLDRVGSILIRGDWISGQTETVLLDNVRIAPVPVPSSFSLLLFGGFGLFAIRRFFTRV